MTITPRCLVAISPESLKRIRKILGKDNNDKDYDLSEAIDQILKKVEQDINNTSDKETRRGE